MIRKANLDDLEGIEETYNEHFNYEIEHRAFTVFKKGVYPTRNHARKAIEAGTLYVYEKDNDIAGSLILDQVQPPEYQSAAWKHPFTVDEVMVVHLLLVRPSLKGKGIASALIQYAEKLAKNKGCQALRLDTGSQNLPAVTLYQKLRFEIVGSARMKVGSVIEHSGHLFLEKIL